MPHFTKKTILSTLSLLAERLTEDHRHADIYIFGGAGLVLDGLRTVTADIDICICDPNKWRLLSNHAKVIAQEPGQYHLLGSNYDADWLHITFGFLDLMLINTKTYFRPLQGFEHTPQNGGLRVFLLNPAPQLALKLIRVRPKKKDVRDMQMLCQRLGCASSDELYEIGQSHMPLLREVYSNHVKRDKVNASWKAITRQVKKKTSAAPVQTCRT